MKPVPSQGHGNLPCEGAGPAVSGYLTFKETNCKNCYKCIRHCPVKAIGFSKNQAQVMETDCILCGQCFVTCPQNAKSIRQDISAAKALLRSGATVFASVAPSYAAAFGEVGFHALREALLGLGFAGAEETALGATLVKKEYERLIHEGSQKVIISSCCHSINLLVQKYFPDLAGMLARVTSPMLAHGLSLRERHPGAKVVFIGPCLSKKAEAEEYAGAIDSVLTFEELLDWFEQAKIILNSQPQEEDTSGKARLFPITGGILKTLELEAAEYSLMAVDGLESCMAALRDIAKGGISRCFIEMSACAGSCVGGPVMARKCVSPVRDRQTIQKNAGQRDFAVEEPAFSLKRTLPMAPVRRYKFGGKAVAEALAQMGKTLPEHELNCGSCGYDTCREKAEAILSGKAELSMCLPYLMARAESFSDNIINNTPNGILVLNRDFAVQQINSAACQLMNLREAGAVLGRHVVCILDPAPFEEAISGGRNSYEQEVYLAEYQRYVKMTIVRDAKYDILIVIMRDVTNAHAERSGKTERSRKSIEIADKVIEKQMRTVQEIASLLGETTAETKVALEKLKETIQG